MTLYNKIYLIVGTAIVVVLWAITALSLSIAEANEVKRLQEHIDSLEHVIQIEKGLLNEEI